MGEWDNCVQSRSIATMGEFAPILGRHAYLQSLPVPCLVQKSIPPSGVPTTNGIPHRRLGCLHPLQQHQRGYWNPEEDYRVSWL
jgi:hypothetical protein